jgi:Lon protease-like protein
MRISSTSLIPVDWLDDVPMFPLPRVVFFPGTLLPLHVFEPRYREMMKDSLARDRLLMAVSLLKPGYEAEYDGRPAVHEICGLGRIEQHEELPDGRFNLVLRGLTRVHLYEQPADDKPYRRVKVEMLDAKRGSERVSRDALTTLMSTASLVATAVRRRHPDFSLGIAQDDPPHQIADTLADRLLAEPEARQDLLETLDVCERIKKLTSYVATLLGQMEIPTSPGSRGTVQ